MDKYEYKIRAEEIKSLIEQGEYLQAAEIADTIDWRRVKSVMMLCTISDVYKINRRYEDARDMLLLAYDRHPGGRAIVYSLCELSVKMGDFVQAVEYYKEFVQVAPRDTSRFILQYKLYEAQDVGLEERIAVLEEMIKNHDYREKWMYELAYLYHRLGLPTQCVEICDELILYFSKESGAELEESKYVIKAMELKMLHQSLSPEQQRKYDARFGAQSQGTEAVYYGMPQNGESTYYGAVPEAATQYGAVPEATMQYGAVPETTMPYGAVPEATMQYGAVPEATMPYGAVPEATMPYGAVPEATMQYGAVSEAAMQYGAVPEATIQYEPVAGTNMQYNAVSQPVVQDTPIEEMDIQVKTVDVGQYNTINLQKELAEGLKEVLGESEPIVQDPITRSIIAPMMESDTEALDLPQIEEVDENALESEEMQGSEVFFGETGEISVWEAQTESADTEPHLIRRDTAELVMEQLRLENTAPIPPIEIQEEEPVIEEQEQAWNVEEENVQEEAFAVEERMQEEVFAVEEDMQEEAFAVEEDMQEEAFAVEEDVQEEAFVVEESMQEEAFAVEEDIQEETFAVEESMQEEAFAVEDVQEEAFAVEEDMQEEAFAVEESIQEEAFAVEEDIQEETLVEEIVPERVESEESGAEAVEVGAAADSATRKKAVYAQIEAVEKAAPKEILIDTEALEKQITGQLSIEDILAEWERLKKENEEKNKEQMVQKVLTHTGPMFTEFEASVRDGLLEQLEERKNAEQAIVAANAANAFMEESEELGAVEELEEIREWEDVEDPEIYEDVEEAAEQERLEEAVEKAEVFEETKLPQEAEQLEAVEETEVSCEELQEVAAEAQEVEALTKEQESQISEEAQNSKPAAEPAQTEENLKSSAEPAQAEENPKPTAEPAQTEENLKSSAEPAQAEENPEPTAQPVQREKARVRNLTREERELFGAFIQNKSSREKLVKAIDSISMAAYTGNVIITGEEGMDTLNLAKNMVREVQMTDSNFSGKTAKISGNALNSKNPGNILEQLKNGALIIQKASEMNNSTIESLYKGLQQESLGIIVVLEDNRKAMDRLLKEHPQLKSCFNARMDMEALSNESLVLFGRKYAREREYAIDEMGVLALHTRIEDMQTSDHVVTVMEVKEIVDEAIRRAKRKSFGHFVDVLLAKRYDDEDMIILREKDFV